LNAASLHAIAHWLHRRLVPVAPRLIDMFIYLVFHAVIPAESRIGARVQLAHGGLGIVLHPRCEIGCHVHIGAHVVIGGRSLSKRVPRIGDNVYIGAGAKILGDIEIGNDVIIGANAVVIRSVASHTIVAGVPAKVIRENIQVREYESW
jgi:serine O-acetyltransferase